MFPGGLYDVVLQSRLSTIWLGVLMGNTSSPGAPITLRKSSPSLMASPNCMIWIFSERPELTCSNALAGSCVHQIQDHSHFVQGVAWDPLNEYLATQSSDR